MKRRKPPPILAVLALAAAVAALVSWHGSTPTAAASIRDGVIDLTGMDLEGTIARLPLEWDYYPGVLYAPEELADQDAPVPRPFVPEDERLYATGTYRAVLRVAPGRTYGLSAYSLDYATRIYANGSVEWECGVVSQTPEGFVPRVHNYVIPLHAHEGELDIVVQYANFVHREGGAFRAMTFSAFENVQREAVAGMLPAYLICGALLLLTLYHLLDYIDRRRREALWFAACCALLAIRNQNFFLQMVPQEYNWPLAYHTLVIGTILLVPLFLLLINSLYPRDFLSGPVYAALGGAGLAILLVLALPLSRAAVIAGWYTILCVPLIVWYLFTLIRNLDRRKPEDWLAVLGVGLLLLSLLLEGAIQNRVQLVARTGLAPLGMLAFALCYMMLLRIRGDQEAERLALAERRNALLRDHNKMAGDFLTAFSHDVRASLSRTGNRLERLHELHGRDGASRKLVAAARAELDEVVQYLSNLLAVTRTELGESPCRPVWKPLGELLPLLQLRFEESMEDWDLDFHIAPFEAVEVQVDEQRFFSVIGNLLHNAGRYTPRGGSVEVRAAYGDGALEITVEDTGRGIPPERLPLIFQKGFHGPELEHGHGHGLYIAKRYMEGMGGGIRVESVPGEGTRFRLTFPARPQG